MNFIRNLFKKDQPSEIKASSGSPQVKELLLGLPVIKEDNISNYRQTIISAESHPSMFVGLTNETAGFVAKMSEETERFILSSQGIARVEKRFLMNDYRVGERILEIQYQQFWNNGTSSIYSEHVMRIGEDKFEVFGSESSAKRMKAVWPIDQKQPPFQSSPLTQPDIEKMKIDGDITGLIKTLGHTKDAIIRRDAARALGVLKDACAVESLIAALGDNEWPARWAAADALGNIGDTNAVEPLIAALKDETVRIHAVKALGLLGDTRAINLLVAMINDEDKAVSTESARALGMIGDICLVEPLIAALNNRNADTRAVSAEALGKIGDPRAVKPLITALGDKTLVSGRVSSYTGWFVSDSAADALCEIGAPAVEPLVNLLSDNNKSEHARIWAAQALGRIGAPAVEPLIDLLNDKDKDEDARKQAAYALGNTGDTRAIEPLNTASKDENDQVRIYATNALKKLSK